MSYEGNSGDISSKTPFLDEKIDSNGKCPIDDAAPIWRPRAHSWIYQHRKAAICHGIMICGYLLLTIVFMKTPKLIKNHLLFTPIKDNLRYVVQEIKDSPRDIMSSKFVGTPNPDIDKEWEHLTRFHNLRITEEEMQAMNLNTSHAISFARGGGYHGMMGVFHELHCLKLVRQATLPDYYYGDKSDAERAYLAGHTDHCIEILRTSIMCRADPMIFPYHWVDANRVPNPTWVQKHECADWNQLEDWLETRRVDIHTPNVLVHPKYGPTYPGGQKIEEPDGPQWYPLDPE